MDERREYTLQNREMQELVSALHCAVERVDPNTNYTVLGGVGIQTRVAKVLSANGEISNIGILQKVLRPTDDVDVILGDRGYESIFYDQSSGFLCNGKMIKSKQDRFSVFIKDYPKIDVGLEHGFGLNERISRRVLEESETVELKYKNNEFALRVPRLEHQLISKARLMREKDVRDINIIVGLAKMLSGQVHVIDANYLQRELYDLYPSDVQRVLEDLQRFDSEVFEKF